MNWLITSGAFFVPLHGYRLFCIDCPVNRKSINQFHYFFCQIVFKDKSDYRPYEHCISLCILVLVITS